MMKKMKCALSLLVVAGMLAGLFPAAALAVEDQQLPEGSDPQAYTEAVNATPFSTYDSTDEILVTIGNGNNAQGFTSIEEALATTVGNTGNTNLYLQKSGITDSIVVPAGARFILNGNQHTFNGQFVFAAASNEYSTTTATFRNLTMYGSGNAGAYDTALYSNVVDGNGWAGNNLVKLALTVNNCTFSGFENAAMYLTNLSSLTIGSNTEFNNNGANGDYVIDINQVVNTCNSISITESTFTGVRGTLASIRVAQRGGADDFTDDMPWGDIPNQAPGASIGTVTLSKVEFKGTAPATDVVLGAAPSAINGSKAKASTYDFSFVIDKAGTNTNVSVRGSYEAESNNANYIRANRDQVTSGGSKTYLSGGSSVARIGNDEYYGSLQEAVTAARSKRNSVITLLADTSGDVKIPAGSNFSIVGNKDYEHVGHIIFEKAEKDSLLSATTVEITNLHMVAPSNSNSYAYLSDAYFDNSNTKNIYPIDLNLTISGGSVTGYSAGALYATNAYDLTIKNVDFVGNGGNFVIDINLIDTTNAAINIQGCSFSSNRTYTNTPSYGYISAAQRGGSVDDDPKVDVYENGQRASAKISSLKISGCTFSTDTSGSFWGDVVLGSQFNQKRSVANSNSYNFNVEVANTGGRAIDVVYRNNQKSTGADEKNNYLVRSLSSGYTLTCSGDPSKITVAANGGGNGSGGGGGGGVANNTHTITATPGAGGMLTPSGRVTVVNGSSQTFGIHAFDGYKVLDVLVDNVSVGAVTSYTFSNVGESHSIVATFIADDNAPAGTLGAFTDIPANAWYRTAASFAVNQKLMVGTSNTTFSPNQVTTRAEFVTILGRYAESQNKTITGSGSFNDVVSGAYYEKYVGWAVENGIVLGYSNGNFGTNDAITREQMASLIVRFAAYMNIELGTGISVNFNDAASIGSGHADDVLTIAQAGIVKGDDTGAYRPQAGSTRAEIAQVLYNFLSK